MELSTDAMVIRQVNNTGKNEWGIKGKWAMGNAANCHLYLQRYHSYIPALM